MPHTGRGQDIQRLVDGFSPDGEGFMTLVAANLHGFNLRGTGRNKTWLWFYSDIISLQL